ncbi:MAG: hypothetical protein QOF94_1813, partial [Acidobacteriaceae bacterium]
MFDEGSLLKRRFGKSTSSRAISRITRLLAVLTVLVFLAGSALAESCLSASDMDAATRNALTGSGTRYFDMIARGDVASLRQNSIPSLAGDFSGIEGTVKENQAALAGSKGSLRPPFLLEAQGTA